MNRVVRLLKHAGIVDDELHAVLEEVLALETLHPVYAAVLAGVNEDAVAHALAEACGSPLVEKTPSWTQTDLVDERLSKRLRAVPLQFSGPHHLTAGFVDPSDADAIRDLAAVTGCTIDPRTIRYSAWHAYHYQNFQPPSGGPGLMDLLFDWENYEAGRTLGVDEVVYVIGHVLHGPGTATVHIDAEKASLEHFWTVPEMDGRYDITRALVGELRRMTNVTLGGGIGRVMLGGFFETVPIGVVAEFSDDDSTTTFSTILLCPSDLSEEA